MKFLIYILISFTIALISRIISDTYMSGYIAGILVECITIGFFYISKWKEDK